MYCKYCGKVIDNDSIFCKFCGRKLIKQEPEKIIDKEYDETTEDISKNKRRLFSDIYENCNDEYCGYDGSYFDWFDGSDANHIDWECEVK